MYAINGRFTVHKFGGQERYSYEMVQALDKIVKKGEFELVVPKYARNIPVLTNIEIVKYGSIKSHLWEQIDFLLYLIKNKRIGVNTCITAPILKPDIVTIHDIAQLVHPEWYNNFYGRMSTLWHRIIFNSSIHFAKIIFTSSNFSKDEIVRYYKISPDRITVIGCGWQHFNRIIEDKNTLNKYKELESGNYYLSASSITPQKNFQWVRKAANENKDRLFAIVGEKISLTNENVKDTNNLQYLGRVADGELKNLMRNCKAFIHPAKYEGFGITPMEALSVGAPIIISNAASLPEIYGKTAHYIDPNNSNVDLDKLLKEPTSEANTVLNKYNWDALAEIMYQKIINYTR